MAAKARNRQRGDAHTWIIIILVVALLGTLGFVFWQNFSKNKDAGNTAGVTKTEQKTKKSSAGSTAGAEEESDNRQISLSDWGVVIPLEQGDPEFTLERTTEYVDGYYFGLTQSGDCSPGSVGVITRHPSGTRVVNIGGSYGEGTYDDMSGSIKVKGYVYVFAGPQGLCSDDSSLTRRQTEGTELLKNRVQQLKEQ